MGGVGIVPARSFAGLKATAGDSTGPVGVDALPCAGFARCFAEGTRFREMGCHGDPASALFLINGCDGSGLKSLMCRVGNSRFP